MKRNVLSVALLFFIGWPLAQAEIYKWVDDNGQIHYSEQPPEKKRAATEIRIRSYAPHAPLVSRGQRKQQRDNLLRAFAEERELRNEAKAKEEKKMARNQKNCIRARDKLKNYERATSLYDLDEKGERVYLSDAQRSSAETNLRNQISKWCQ